MRIFLGIVWVCKQSMIISLGMRVEGGEIAQGL